MPHASHMPSLAATPLRPFAVSLRAAETTWPRASVSQALTSARTRFCVIFNFSAAGPSRNASNALERGRNALERAKTRFNVFLLFLRLRSGSRLQALRFPALRPSAVSLCALEKTRKPAQLLTRLGTHSERAQNAHANAQTTPGSSLPHTQHSALSTRPSALSTQHSALKAPPADGTAAASHPGAPPPRPPGARCAPPRRR